jgi:hypothetical protein
MTRAFTIRLLSLYLPLVAAFAVWLWRKPGQRDLTGALLATAWNVPALFAINLLAIHFGWWHFNVQGAVVCGVPVDLWLGWAVLWGFVAALVSAVSGHLLQRSAHTLSIPAAHAHRKAR